jgi:hypothetical protein
MLIFVIGAIVIIGALFLHSWGLSQNEKEIVQIAYRLNLTPIGEPDYKMTTIGTPFNYINRNMTITTLPVEDKANKRTGMLYIRHGWSDDIIGVFNGKEVEYR